MVYIYIIGIILVVLLISIILLKILKKDKSKLNYGDYEGRIKKYTLRIQFDVNDEMAFYQRGLAYLKLGNKKAALDDLNMAVRLGCSKAYDVIEKYQLEKPSDNQVYVKNQNYIGIQNNSKTAEYRGAIDDYTKIIKSNPKNSVAYLMRAGLKELSNDYVGALDDLTSALKNNNKYPEAYYKRGNIKMKLNDLQGAQTDLEIAFKLGFRKAKKILDKIGITLEQAKQNT